MRCRVWGTRASPWVLQQSQPSHPTHRVPAPHPLCLPCTASFLGDGMRICMLSKALGGLNLLASCITLGSCYCFLSVYCV